jgi:hypothetical protein
MSWLRVADPLVLRFSEFPDRTGTVRLYSGLHRRCHLSYHPADGELDSAE